MLSSLFVRPLLAPLLLTSALLLSACAARPPANDPDALAEYRENNDPAEPTNRFFYRVNDGLDTYVLAPIARGYRYAVPGAVRRPVQNVLANLSSPIIFANDVLQTRPRRAGDTLMRFLINSTAGVGGLFDVASRGGVPKHDQDFGLTLGHYGVPSGPYLVLPLFGPSTVRDAVGFGIVCRADQLDGPGLAQQPVGPGLLQHAGALPERHQPDRRSGARPLPVRARRLPAAAQVADVSQPVVVGRAADLQRTG